MALFEEIIKKISDASQSVVQKGKDMSDTVKINVQISDEEKKVTLVYTEIGKMYVSKYEGKYEDEIKPFVDELSYSLQKIETLKNKLVNMKRVVICATCGTENAKDSKFCAKCGTGLMEQSVNNDKLCSKCGAPLGEGLRFCTTCGHPIE